MYVHTYTPVLSLPCSWQDVLTIFTLTNINKTKSFVAVLRKISQIWKQEMFHVKVKCQTIIWINTPLNIKFNFPEININNRELMET